jgi:hypothetical protein
MALPFPYGAKQVAGWDRFQSHHEIFARNILIFLSLTLTLLGINWLPRTIQIIAMKPLEIAWVVLSLYFASSHANRVMQLQCPHCGQRFFGAFRWDPYKCRHCGIKLWTPLIPADRTGGRLSK